MECAHPASDNLPEKPTGERCAVFTQHLIQQHGNRLCWRPPGKGTLDCVPPELHPEPSDGHAADLVLDARDINVERADGEM